MAARIKKIIFGIVILLIVAAIGLSLYGVKNQIEITSTGVGGSINDLGELATSEYSFTRMQEANKPAKEIIGLKIPFTSSKVIYSYDGSIKAGLNFEEIEIEPNFLTKKVHIRLPETRILSSEVDNDSLIVYDEHNSPFNSLTFEDMNLSVVSLKENAEKAAIEKGLLDNAKTNAETLIRSYIEKTYRPGEYEIIFE